MGKQPYDEPELTAEDTLIRRVDPNYHLVWDDNLQCTRISSKLFSPSSGQNGGMSVDVEKLIVADGHNPMAYVTTPKYMGSVSLTVGLIRDSNLQVGYTPTTDNPYHADVWGTNRPNRFTGSQKRELMNSCCWYVEIDGVCLRAAYAESG